MTITQNSESPASRFSNLSQKSVNPFLLGRDLLDDKILTKPFRRNSSFIKPSGALRRNSNAINGKPSSSVMISSGSKPVRRRNTEFIESSVTNSQKKKLSSERKNDLPQDFNVPNHKTNSDVSKDFLSKLSQNNQISQKRNISHNGSQKLSQKDSNAQNLLARYAGLNHRNKSRGSVPNIKMVSSIGAQSTTALRRRSVPVHLHKSDSRKNLQGKGDSNHEEKHTKYKPSKLNIDNNTSELDDLLEEEEIDNVFQDQNSISDHLLNTLKNENFDLYSKGCLEKLRIQREQSVKRSKTKNNEIFLRNQYVKKQLDNIRAMRLREELSDLDKVLTEPAAPQHDLSGQVRLAETILDHQNQLQDFANIRMEKKKNIRALKATLLHSSQAIRDYEKAFGKIGTKSLPIDE